MNTGIDNFAYSLTSIERINRESTLSALGRTQYASKYCRAEVDRGVIEIGMNSKKNMKGKDESGGKEVRCPGEWEDTLGQMTQVSGTRREDWERTVGWREEEQAKEWVGSVSSSSWWCLREWEAGTDLWLIEMANSEPNPLCFPYALGVRAIRIQLYSCTNVENTRQGNGKGEDSSVKNGGGRGVLSFFSRAQWWLWTEWARVLLPATSLVVQSWFLFCERFHYWGGWGKQFNGYSKYYP